MSGSGPLPLLVPDDFVLFTTPTSGSPGTFVSGSVVEVAVG